MRHLIHTLCLILFTAAVCLFSGCGKKEKPLLVMGTESTFPPFEYYFGNKITGIDPEILRIFADEAGYELAIEDISFDYLLHALQTGQIDVAASGITVTEERQKLVDFTESYATAGVVIVVPHDSPIRSAAELKGKIIGVQRSSTSDEFVTSRIQEPSRFINVEVAAKNLLEGKIDALVTDSGPAKILVKQERSLRLLPQPLTVEHYAFAVRKGRTELLKQLNNTIARLKRSGRLVQLQERHEIAALQKPQNGEEPKKLRAAIDPTFPPFGFVQDGQPQGIEIDLLKRIAAELNMEISFEQVGFDSLFEAVASDNGIDIGAGSISITPERAKIVNFTLPFFDSRQYLFLRRESPCTKPEQLKGKRLGAIYCSTAEKYIRDHFGEPECYSEGELLFKALAAGEIDGAVMDETPAEIFMQNFRNLKKLPEPLLVEQYAFVIRKENRELLEKINAVMQKLENCGEAAKIREENFRRFKKK